ncbi:PH domain-containing protein [Dysgonomonas sp. 520]|uniref:PH domain-containing protein n=1 Tax=Dysgonomonas sp. 520 TaxID=2302931 RepID=UPI0013D23573|nr:PH domain-containing protein [Dysgonomonas sp. 520]NDW10485.1 hypothetical protein [Dysgonomonas sp. 520]
MTFEELQQTNLYKGKVISMNKKSIKMMLDSIFPGEEILIITNCNVGSTPGVITLTSKRAIFTSKVLFNSVRHEFALKNITSITMTSSLANTLIIDSFNQKLTITAIDKNVAQDFISLYNITI